MQIIPHERCTKRASANRAVAVQKNCEPVLTRRGGRAPSERAQRGPSRVAEIILSAIGRVLRGGDKVEIRRGSAASDAAKESPYAAQSENRRAVAVPTKRISHFKVGKELRELMNTGKALMRVMTANSWLECRLHRVHEWKRSPH